LSQKTLLTIVNFGLGANKSCRAGAGAARSRNIWPELEPIFASFGSSSWPSAPGQTKVAYFIIIDLEQDKASDLNRYSFEKIMKTLNFYQKAVQTGAYQDEVGAGFGDELFKSRIRGPNK
jgi:hypothetical protein